jgi:hydroxymethylglutaryl-CoA reductase
MPERFSEIFERSEGIIRKASIALKEYDLEEVGSLMDLNHDLLREIEVSHPALDELVKIAREAGALGAKMTGGGLGGYMVALTPGPQIQEDVASAMEAAGYEALRTSIGV